MHVAIDATPLTLPSGGARRHTWELSRALAESFPSDVFWLISDQSFPLPAPLPPNLRPGHGPKSYWERTKWWSYGVQREMARLDASVFWGPDFSVPYLPVRPSVLMILDLSPWKFPGASNRVRRRTPWLLRLRSATLIMTISGVMRQEIIDFFRVPASRVFSIPLAAGAEFHPTPAPPQERPYFLYVGALESRKNLPIIVDAWRTLRSRHDVDLVLAGRPRPGFPSFPSEPGLHVLGEIPDSQLPSLYTGSIASLYPSLYEGFGLPVLEAMQSGTPVIASRDPAVMEVAGGAAIHCHASTVSQWETAMEALLISPGLRGEWREKGLRRAADFSWRKSARLTRELFDEAIRQFRA